MPRDSSASAAESSGCTAVVRENRQRSSRRRISSLGEESPHPRHQEEGGQTTNKDVRLAARLDSRTVQNGGGADRWRGCAGSAEDRRGFDDPRFKRRVPRMEGHFGTENSAQSYQNTDDGDVCSRRVGRRQRHHHLLLWSLCVDRTGQDTTRAAIGRWTWALLANREQRQAASRGGLPTTYDMIRK